MEPVLLMDEMVCLHGRPHIRRFLSVMAMIMSSLVKVMTKLCMILYSNDALQVLRKHYVSRPGDIFVATYPKVCKFRCL